VRSRDPEDARSNRVHITAKGIRMLKAIMPIDPLIEARVVEPLPPEYRPLFLKCLRLMAGLEPGAAGSSVDSRDGQR
jgi:DNA-binding MarR family transcriptional regulator